MDPVWRTVYEDGSIRICFYMKSNTIPSIFSWCLIIVLKTTKIPIVWNWISTQLDIFWGMSALGWLIGSFKAKSCQKVSQSSRILCFFSLRVTSIPPRCDTRQPSQRGTIKPPKDHVDYKSGPKAKTCHIYRIYCLAYATQPPPTPLQQIPGLSKSRFASEGTRGCMIARAPGRGSWCWSKRRAFRKTCRGNLWINSVLMRSWGAKKHHAWNQKFCNEILAILLVSRGPWP